MYLATYLLFVCACKCVYAAPLPACLGRRRTVGEGESQARIDEENPGEIIKEKEGKEGPLKGSNENLNLQLAGSEANGSATDNGNVTTPVKELPADGKDTAV